MYFGRLRISEEIRWHLYTTNVELMLDVVFNLREYIINEKGIDKTKKKKTKMTK